MRKTPVAKTLAFNQTKTMFKDYLNGKDKYEYDEWKHLSNDCKAAALYLNFYDTIMANLYRARQHKPIPGDDNDLVSVAVDKCQRIIEVLDTQPEKYTRGYVSLVMYNAFSVTLSQLVSSKQKQFDVFNTFNFCETADLLGKSNAFSSATDNYCVDDVIEEYILRNASNIDVVGMDDELAKAKLWKVVRNQPDFVQDIIAKLINGGKLGKRQQEILPYLREIFAEFAPECAESVL